MRFNNFADSTFTASDGHPSINLDPVSLSQLSHPTSQLDDDCINQCMKLLYHLFPSQHANNCTHYSMYVLTNHRNPKNDNNCIWRNSKHTECWMKLIWIIPIHRPTQQHWVLCIVNRISKHIDFFDSIAQWSEWMNNIEVSITTLSRLSQSKFYTTGCNDTHIAAGTYFH